MMWVYQAYWRDCSLLDFRLPPRGRCPWASHYAINPRAVAIPQQSTMRGGFRNRAKDLFGLRANQAQVRLTSHNQPLCLRCCSSAANKQASNAEA